MRPLLPLLVLTASLVAADRPNIILILADDMGYGDAGCYGGTLAPTPAIDSLARDGVRFTDGYVTAPVCAPSRCGLMSGAYNQRFGMQWNDDRYAYQVQKHALLPQALKAAGYATGHLGKWNIGADITGCFDEARSIIDWESDYFPGPDGKYIGLDGTKKASSKRQGVWWEAKPGEEYLTDRLGRQAVEFIDRHQQQPFFLYLAFNAVHAPWQAKAADQARLAHIPEEPLRMYAAMLASLDENVGRVLAKVKETGLEQNTLVVFLSDNGPARGGYTVWPDRWPDKNIIFGSAGPLSGFKAQFLEGGIREPYILRWPARLKAGMTFRQPVSTMDIYPTCCAAAGAAVPTGTTLDGVDLLPWLTGDKAVAPHDLLFWKNGEQGAVRQGAWKVLISTWKPKIQLFNLADDVGEKQDLAAQNPALTERLHQAWQTWSATLPLRASPAKPEAKNSGH